MANVRISHEELYEALMAGNVLHSVVSMNGEHAPTEYVLFGKWVLPDENGALVYEACEYCGQNKIGKRGDCAECGAPLSNQGVRLTRRAADGAIQSAIFEALFGTPRR
jgi:hypothetical protein